MAIALRLSLRSQSARPYILIVAHVFLVKKIYILISRSLTKSNFDYIIVLQVIHKGDLIMTTISLRVNDDESKLIHDYVSVNQLNMSQFIRDAVLDKIENDLDLDEDRILYAFEKAKQEKTYDHTEVWKMLGV